MGQKRQRDDKGLTNQANKRKKPAKSDNATNSEDASDGFVNVDELNWKAVPLPDRMEDVGGFFGLEEIDDVDVVRPEGTAEIRFRAKPGKKKDSLSRKMPEEVEFDDEWSGFSDEEPEKDDTAPAVQKSAKKENMTDRQEHKKDAKKESQKETKKDGKKEAKEDKRVKKEQKEKNAKGQQDHSIKPGLSFTALQEEGEDDGVDISAWDTLGLSPELLTGISKLKFTTPTSAQQACIPQILEGHDVVGKASTGSGKTLAFGIPILEHCLGRTRQKDEDEYKKDSSPAALILSPTRELAHQLAKHIGELASVSPAPDAKIALLTGGLSVQKQQRQLANADIVIGTPGRVWEILSSGQGLIKKMQLIKFLVVDEADRLLSQGHYKELGQVVDSLDRVETFEVPEAEGQDQDESNGEDTAQRQTLVFSATFHRDLQQKLSGKGQWRGGDLLDKKESMEYLLKRLQFREEKPKFIDVNPISQMAENLKEGIVECGPMDKDLYLYTLLLYHPKHRTLLFTNSISAVRRLTQLLQTLNLPALALHSSMPQKARLRSVERFSSPSSSNQTSILVATDVAARGLDIKGIDFVIHYHAPRTADTYVHRSGRTARAGAAGKSVIICGPEEMQGVIRLAAKVHSQHQQQEPEQQQKQQKRLPLETLDLDRRIVSRVKPRITLAARITDAQIAKEKVSTEDNWLRTAADDLGVEYDSEEFDNTRAKGRGRGKGRHQRDKETGSISKADIGAMRAELKKLLAQRVNVGVSEKYLTAGRVDVEALLRGEGNAAFLGPVDPLAF